MSGYRSPDLSGYRTMVTNPDGTMPSDSEKEQVLPSPPWSRSKPMGTPSYNVPGPSSDAADGKTIHKDKVRTPGVPGAEWGHPVNDGTAVPKRRVDTSEDVEAAITGPTFPGGNRQKEQRGQAKRYFQRYYKKNRNKIRQRMKRWHRKWHSRPALKRDKKRRDSYPDRYTRRPGGATSIKDRSQKQRDKAKSTPGQQQKKKAAPTGLIFSYLPTGAVGTFIQFDVEQDTARVVLDGREMLFSIQDFLETCVFHDETAVDQALQMLDDAYTHDEDGEDWDDDEDLMEDWWFGEGRDAAAPFRIRHRPVKRQRRQRGLKRHKNKRNYRKNRQKNKQRAKLRYRRLKKNPAFKRQQKIRRKNPQLFKRRRGSVLTTPDIAFVIGDDLRLGYVHEVSPLTGMVTFHCDDATDAKSDVQFQSMPVEEFLDAVAFLSDEDIDSMFELIDTEIGWEAYSDDDEGPEGVDCSLPENASECAGLESDTPAELSTVDTDLIEEYFDGEFPRKNTGEDQPYIHGQVHVGYAEMIRREPPDMPVDQQFNRGSPAPLVPTDRIPGNSLPGEVNVVWDNPGSAKVIPDGKGFVNKQAAFNRVALRISEIQEGCDPRVKELSQGLKPQTARFSPKSVMWLFNVPGSKGDYRVRVKARPKGNTVTISKMDVQVSCTCPYWQWQGPEHWAKASGYLYGRPRGTAAKPGVKDPNGTHRACKHVLAVFDMMKNYTLLRPVKKKGSVSLGALRVARRYLVSAMRGGQ